MKPGKRRVLVLASILTAGAILLFWQELQYKATVEATAISTASASSNAVNIETATVEITNLNKFISAIGTLRAKESVELVPEISGRIVKILFEEGQRIESGAELFQLDTSILDASVQSASAAYELALSTYKRTEELSQKGVGAVQALDEARANLHSTEAALALAKAQLEQTTIRAPFNGAIGLRSVSVGAYITAGSTSLAKLNQIDLIVAEFTLPEVALGDVAVGQQVSVTTDAFIGQTFSGTIYAIEPSIDEAGRSIRMRALIDNQDIKLRPGLFARIDVTVGSKANALLVPESAIVPRGESQMIYRINDDDVIEIVQVSLGQRLDGKVEILNGLDENARIVTAGQQKLQSGSKVSYQNTEDSV